MHDHLKSGRKDGRAHPRRADLVAAGVPVDQRCRLGWKRPDRRWHNTELSKWKRDHPEATPEEISIESRRISGEWTSEAHSSMDLDPGLPALVEGDSDDGDGNGVDASYWETFDREWPVRADVLENFVATHPASDSSALGFAAKATLIRQSVCSGLYVQDDGAIPDERVYKIRKSCAELHPGLCVTRDQSIYTHAVNLAKSLEAALGPELLHRFFMLGDSTTEH